MKALALVALALLGASLIFRVLIWAFFRVDWEARPALVGNLALLGLTLTGWGLIALVGFAMG